MRLTQDETAALERERARRLGQISPKPRRLD